jgi:hypothetical protein
MASSTSGSRQVEKPETRQPTRTTLVAKREKLRLYNQAYYQQHKPEKRASNRHYHQLYRAERNAKRRQRYQLNPAPYRTATRQWVSKNPERRKVSQKA